MSSKKQRLKKEKNDYILIYSGGFNFHNGSAFLTRSNGSANRHFFLTVCSTSHRLRSCLTPIATRANPSRSKVSQHRDGSSAPQALLPSRFQHPLLVLRLAFVVMALRVPCSPRAVQKRICPLTLVQKNSLKRSFLAYSSVMQFCFFSGQIISSKMLQAE